METDQSQDNLQDNLQNRASAFASDLRGRAAGVQEGATEALHRADVYVRENPVPTILGALAVGFLIGVLVRSSEPTPRSRWNDARDDAEDQLRSLLSAISKKGKKAYKRSAEAISDAADAARNIDMDDYTDPVTSWFSKLWKKVH
jgi:ElaB/YqjD/DUF883 family membrane-anchored ribosome-binding protein